MTIENTIIFLIGYPGVGKYSIALELCQRTGARLIDNHLINNPIFTVVDLGGSTPVPVRPATWEKIALVRRAVFEAVAEIGPPGVSYVFTNVLLDEPGDAAIYREVLSIATARDAAFLPVVLTCGPDEHLRRMTNPARRERMKWTDGEGLRDMVANRPLLPVEHPNLVELDTTNLTAEAAADALVARLVAVTGTAR